LFSGSLEEWRPECSCAWRSRFRLFVLRAFRWKFPTLAGCGASAATSYSASSSADDWTQCLLLLSPVQQAAHRARPEKFLTAGTNCAPSSNEPVVFGSHSANNTDVLVIHLWSTFSQVAGWQPTSQLTRAFGARASHYNNLDTRHLRM